LEGKSAMLLEGLLKNKIENSQFARIEVLRRVNEN
jgi:hypothetical protein